MNPTNIAIDIFEHLLSAEQRALLTDPNHIGRVVEQGCIPSWFPDGVIVPPEGLIDTYGGEPVCNAMLVLGAYHPIASPARVLFYRDNITNYSATLIRDLVHSGISFELDTCLLTIHFVVKDVWQHESFHYFCDVARRITNSEFCRNTEEALAVASSHRHMDDWHTNYHAFVHGSDFEQFFFNYFKSNENHKRSRKIFEFLISKHFSNFRSPGYRDWGKYSGKDLFSKHVFDYIGNGTTRKLVTQGVPLDEMTFWQAQTFRDNKGAQIQIL